MTFIKYKKRISKLIALSLSVTLAFSTFSFGTQGLSDYSVAYAEDDQFGGDGSGGVAETVKEGAESSGGILGSTGNSMGTLSSAMGIMGSILGNSISDQVSYRTVSAPAASLSSKCTASGAYSKNPTVNEQYTIKCTCQPQSGYLVVPPQITFSGTPTKSGKIQHTGVQVAFQWMKIAPHTWGWVKTAPVITLLELNAYEGSTSLASNYGWDSWDTMAYDDQNIDNSDINNSDLTNGLIDYNAGDVNVDKVDIQNADGTYTDGVTIDNSGNPVYPNGMTYDEYVKYLQGQNSTTGDSTSIGDSIWSSSDIGNNSGSGNGGDSYSSGGSDWANGDSNGGSSGSNGSSSGGSGGDGTNVGTYDGTGFSGNGSDINNLYNDGDDSYNSSEFGGSSSGNGYGTSSGSGSGDGTDGSGSGSGYGSGSGDSTDSSYSSSSGSGSGDDIFSSGDLSDYFGSDGADDGNFDSYGNLTDDLLGADGADSGVGGADGTGTESGDFASAGFGDGTDGSGQYFNGTWDGSQGYFDEYGVWHEGVSPLEATGQGYYDENGVWHDGGESNGYFDADGKWHPYENGEYDYSAYGGIGGMGGEGGLLGALQSAMGGVFGNSDSSNAGFGGLFGNNSTLSSIFNDMLGGIENSFLGKVPTLTNQQLFDNVKDILKKLGYDANALKKGTNYDPNSAYTQPNKAWDFNRITKLLKDGSVKIEDESANGNAKAGKNEQDSKTSLSNATGQGQQFMQKDAKQNASNAKK